MRLRPELLLFAVLLIPSPVRAQDAFETEVYRYKTAERSAWELEGQLNYVAQGTTTSDNLVAPTEHQGHFALEVTRGLTDHWEVGAYLLAAYRPNVGAEYAGWRLRTRVRAPETWRLPVDASLGAELEVTRAPYDENAAGLEIRPTLGRRFGRLQLDFNPIIERGLKARAAGAVDNEWEFEPSARVGFALTRSVDLALEYYGLIGALGSALPANRQVHLFYPSVDVRLGDELSFNLGIGLGTTSVGNRLVFKSRFEVPLGK